jgi:hypothetical protein
LISTSSSKAYRREQHRGTGRRQEQYVSDARKLLISIVICIRVLIFDHAVEMRVPSFYNKKGEKLRYVVDGNSMKRR